MPADDDPGPSRDEGEQDGDDPDIRGLVDITQVLNRKRFPDLKVRTQQRAAKRFPKRERYRYALFDRS